MRFPPLTSLKVLTIMEQKTNLPYTKREVV